MSTVTYADLGTPDVVVKFAQASLTFIHGFVVIEAADQRQIVVQGVGEAGTGVVLVPDVFQLACIGTHGPVVVDRVITATVADPWRVDWAAVEGHEVVVKVARDRLAHRMQTTTLQGEALDAGVLNGHAAKAFRQQSRVTRCNDRGRWEDITHFHDGIEQANFGCAADLGVFVASFALVINRQHVEGATAAVAPITGVELKADHGEGINAKAHCTLGKPRVEFADDCVRPGFGVAIGIAFATVVSRGSAVAVITIEIEVTVQHCKAAAFNEALWLVFSLCRNSIASRQRRNCRQIQWYFDFHPMLL